ncbi:hypothetical protein Hanom_Chr10g00916911 [Helianthus anomalus]
MFLLRIPTGDLRSGGIVLLLRCVDLLALLLEMFDFRRRRCNLVLYEFDFVLFCMFVDGNMWIVTRDV